jgi:DNA-binding response OmpR family regulator
MARIIVVEDDLAQQEEIIAFLTHAGHEPQGVESGITLDQCLQQFTPDIILLDYNLPGENGAALAERLRTRFGIAVGIVMITARSLSVDRIECRRAGADDYLVKPIDFTEMLAVIENLLLRIVSTQARAHVWTLHLSRAELLPPDSPAIPLVGSELSLLKALAGEAHHKASRETLIVAMGKDPATYDPRALETSISRLRRKLPELEDGRNPLRAMRSTGYQFLRPLQIAE